MKKLGKRMWALVLACWMVVSAAVPAYAAQGGGEVVQPMLTEYARTESLCNVSGSKVLTVNNRYTALDDAVTRVVITTYIETYSYDLYNVYTGEFVRHVSSTYVTDKDNLTYNCEAAILADYSYMRVPGKSTVYGASTFPQLRDGFCDHPWVYL